MTTHPDASNDDVRRSAGGDSGTSESLAQMLQRAAEAHWSGGPADALAAAIEVRIVAELPARLRRALGADEAAQRARVLAWERCLAITATDSSPARLEWGFLANHVRWRLADAVRAEVLRHERHPAFGVIPDRPAPASNVPLGLRLERLAEELIASGLDARKAWQFMRVAGDGPRFERALIASRLVEAGAGQRQADALAWLLRGGSGFPSVLARLAVGAPPDRVFGDVSVRRRLAAAASACCDPPIARARECDGPAAGAA